MCGIFGFVGEGLNVQDLINGLKKLEYRGYDSAGIAIENEKNISIYKKEGRIYNLESEIPQLMEKKISTALGHTRWATHGGVSDQNSHPHTDCTGKVAIIHNGIIENFQYLREKLIKNGHIFKSETDSEVIAHMVEENYSGNLLECVIKVLHELNGAYAIGVIHTDEPNCIIAARKGSPLVISAGSNISMLASDVTPILRYSKDVNFLNDGEIAKLTNNGYELYDLDGKTIERKPIHINWDEACAERSGYNHFMEKEIFEQPIAIKSATIGRLKDGIPCIKELEPLKDFIETKLEKIYIVACGTAYHAGLAMKYFMQYYSNIDVSIEVASEFRYMNPKIDGKTLTIAISQSGETLDTLEGVRIARKNGSHVLTVCNVVGSTIPRESDSVIYMNTGPEIGVAATKTYTAQIAILYIVGAQIALWKNIYSEDIKNVLCQIESLPEYFNTVLGYSQKIKELSKSYCGYRNMMYIGRRFGYTAALEGALKLKEISYINATGYQAGELKHGPIALLDQEFPVFAMVCDDDIKEKMISNIMEVKARKARVVAVGIEGDEKIKTLTDDYILIPKCEQAVFPLAVAPVMQLFAYNVALLRELDPDKPRNLAKSVTVE